MTASTPTMIHRELFLDTIFGILESSHLSERNRQELQSVKRALRYGWHYRQFGSHSWWSTKRQALKGELHALQLLDRVPMPSCSCWNPPTLSTDDLYCKVTGESQKPSIAESIKEQKFSEISTFSPLSLYILSSSLTPMSCEPRNLEVQGSRDTWKKKKKKNCSQEKVFRKSTDKC